MKKYADNSNAVPLWQKLKGVKTLIRWQFLFSTIKQLSFLCLEHVWSFWPQWCTELYKLETKIKNHVLFSYIIRISTEQHRNHSDLWIHENKVFLCPTRRPWQNTFIILSFFFGFFCFLSNLWIRSNFRDYFFVRICAWKKNLLFFFQPQLRTVLYNL